jgi:hypothetical protein
MVVTYYGAAFIRIQFGDEVIAFNPPSDKSTAKLGLPAGRQAKFGADIAIVSANHPLYNGIETVSYGGKTPFVIDGPGEYEKDGIYVKGVLAEGGEKGVPLNTVYNCMIDEMQVCHLGALRVSEFKDAVIEQLGVIDVLFVPLSGEGALAPADAYKLALSLEPKIIIPLSGGGPEGEKNLKIFLKEAGADGTARTERLTIKKKQTEEKEGEIMVLDVVSS